MKVTTLIFTFSMVLIFLAGYILGISHDLSAGRSNIQEVILDNN
jgi:hypothetical protein